MLFQMALFERDTQYIVEAGTGIEPVYTDLQSAASPLRQLANRGLTRSLSVAFLSVQRP